MGSLTQEDFSAALDLSMRAYNFESLVRFRCELLPALKGLVAADLLGYNELDLEAGEVIIIFDPADGGRAGIDEAFAATAHQHPGVVSAQNGDWRPNILSNLISVRDFHRLELYQEVYKPLGAEDQIYFNLTAPAMVTIAMSRSRRSFTARDLEMVTLLEPHLRQAYLQTQQRERANALIAAQAAGLEDARAAVVLLDPTGAVSHASTLAQNLLAAYYPGRRDIDGVLPETLGDWLRATNIDVPNTLDVANSRGRLQVRALSGRTSDGWRTLLIDEHVDNSLPNAESLRALGLTGRQVQVLQLLARGESTQRIADDLYLSPATVRKHLENIYERLGAQSRTEAVAIALRQGR